MAVPTATAEPNETLYPDIALGAYCRTLNRRSVLHHAKQRKDHVMREHHLADDISIVPDKFVSRKRPDA